MCLIKWFMEQSSLCSPAAPKKVFSELPMWLHSYAEDELQGPKMGLQDYNESCGALHKHPLHLETDPCLWQGGL